MKPSQRERAMMNTLITFTFVYIHIMKKKRIMNECGVMIRKNDDSCTSVAPSRVDDEIMII